MCRSLAIALWCIGFSCNTGRNVKNSEGVGKHKGKYSYELGSFASSPLLKLGA